MDRPIYTLSQPLTIRPQSFPFAPGPAHRAGQGWRRTRHPGLSTVVVRYGKGETRFQPLYHQEGTQ